MFCVYTAKAFQIPIIPSCPLALNRYCVDFTPMGIVKKRPAISDHEICILFICCSLVFEYRGIPQGPLCLESHIVMYSIFPEDQPDGSRLWKQAHMNPRSLVNGPIALLPEESCCSR